MASKTACNVAQDLWDLETELEPHPLKSYSITNELNLPETTQVLCKSMANLLEVYMDDFFGMMQAPTIEEMQKFMRAILYGIHSIFPPPGPTKDPTDPSPSRNSKQEMVSGAHRKKFWDGSSMVFHDECNLANEKVTKIRAHLIQIS